jgi:hypothetical protein
MLAGESRRVGEAYDSSVAHRTRDAQFVTPAHFSTRFSSKHTEALSACGPRLAERWPGWVRIPKRNPSELGAERVQNVEVEELA